MHDHSLHALTPYLPPQAKIGSIMVWLRDALVTSCISWNKLEPEPWKPHHGMPVVPHFTFIQPTSIGKNHKHKESEK